MKIIKHKFTITFLLITFFFCESSFSQAPKITSLHLNSYHITPQTLCDALIMNPQADMLIYLEATLGNEQEPIIKARTNHFILKRGMNAVSSSDFSIVFAEWGNSKKSQFIRNIHTLPSGKFQHCLKIVPINADVLEGDEECEELESDFVTNIFLIHPSDRDTLAEENPLLIWGLTDPVGLRNTQENYYRIILAAINPGQNAENGLLINPPIFTKENLRTFQIQYPIDAPKLESGKRYGWKIQEIGIDGIVQNQTEAWEFVVKPDKKPKANKYALLGKNLSSGYYTTEDNHVYFCFNKEYSTGEINSFIYNSKREMVTPKIKNTWNSKKGISVTSSGYNQFDINLYELEISRGFHTLEVKNEKGEWWYLRFLVL